MGSREVLRSNGHEGHPAAKLGAEYAPTGGEDHTTKARSVGEQTGTPAGPRAKRSDGAAAARSGPQRPKRGRKTGS
ncbi:MAG TPA: hypothetical protein VGS41_12665 [Chthonomonadales bacterium]|nr:hypothetical protein [Chthonomonadales bacterium]